MTTRVWIGGPTHAHVPVSFATDLAQCYAYSKQRVPTVLGFLQSTYVHVGREMVLKAALKHEATHLLWLDSDMGFPPDTVQRLLVHDQAVVAANCVMKVPQPIFTAIRDGQRIETGPDSTGLEVVDTVGCAVMLLRLDAVADLPRPIFAHGLNDDGGDIGEDLMLCHALRRAGHAIYIDHDLSKEIAHIGSYAYRPPCCVASPVTV
jgi:hypothetical protein